MTLTFHWWMLPPVLVILGLVSWSRQTMDFNFGPVLTGIALIAAALAITVGHFLP